MWALVLVVIGLIVYFIPTMVAWNKHKPDGPIAINFFLGWTFIGWVVALAWAVNLDDHPPKAEDVTQELDKLDQLLKLKGLLDNGTITKEEFENEKAKILGTQLIPPGQTIEL